MKDKDIDFNIIRDRIYKYTCKHKFYKKSLSNNYYLMLIIIELSKAIEADNKKKYCTKYGACIPDKNAFINRRKNGGFDFKADYKELIKDSVEDKLVDVIIILLHLSSYKNFDIYSIENDIDYNTNNKKYMEYFYNRPFIEIIFNIIEEITRFDAELNGIIKIVLVKIFCLAKSLNVDLLWHIEQKMNYNEN